MEKQPIHPAIQPTTISPTPIRPTAMFDSLSQSSFLSTSTSNSNDACVTGDSEQLSTLHILPIPSIIQTDADPIIDGVVVQDEIKSEIICKFKTSALICSILVLNFIVLTVFINRASSTSSSMDSTHPSISPSISSSPTTSFDYRTYVRNIASQISGEEVLNNVTSVQYRVYSLLVLQLPLLVESSILQLNDSKRIAQRYVIGVIGAESSRSLRESTKPISFRSELIDECKHPFFACNENHELTAVYLVNERTTRRGGGIIATEIKELPHLREIVVTRSAVHGTIPTEIGALKDLRILDLSNNFLTGVIPMNVGQLHNLEYMDISQNLLVKQIPPEIKNMNMLSYFDLSHNILSGSIPMELSSLTTLKFLNLYNNSLTGNLENFCNTNSNRTKDIINIEGESVTITYNFIPEFKVDCHSDESEVQCSCCTCG